MILIFKHQITSNNGDISTLIDNADGDTPATTDSIAGIKAFITALDTAYKAADTTLTSDLDAC